MGTVVLTRKLEVIQRTPTADTSHTATGLQEKVQGLRAQIPFPPYFTEDRLKMAAEAPPSPALDTIETTDTLQFRDPNQPNLHVIFWKRPDTPKPRNANVLMFIHGVGEHSGRYRELAHDLLERVPQLDGIASYDQRGHGLSQGERGGIYSVMEAVEDFVEHVSVRLAMEFGEDVNVVVGGHSLGGLICAKSAEGKDWLQEGGYGRIRGVLLSGPAIEIAVNGILNRIMMSFSKVLAAVPGMRRVRKDTGIRKESLTHCAKRLEEIEQDELFHSIAALGLVMDVLKTGGTVVERVKEASVEECVLKGVRLLIIQGEMDSICTVEGSRKLVEAAGDKAELVVVGGAFHEVHNEDDEHGRGEFVETCASFLNRVFEEGM